jgi:hypothetical protein
MKSRGLGDVEYAGKVLGMTTFKEHQRLQDLIKRGKLMPASELAKAKEEEARRAEEFSRSADDEARYKKPRSAPQAKDAKPTTLTYTREPFEE